MKVLSGGIGQRFWVKVLGGGVGQRFWVKVLGGGVGCTRRYGCRCLVKVLDGGDR